MTDTAAGRRGSGRRLTCLGRHGLLDCLCAGRRGRADGAAVCDAAARPSLCRAPGSNAGRCARPGSGRRGSGRGGRRASACVVLVSLAPLCWLAGWPRGACGWPGPRLGEEIGGSRGNTARFGRRIQGVSAQPDRFRCDRGAGRGAGQRGGDRRELADTGLISPWMLPGWSRSASGEGRAGLGSAAASNRPAKTHAPCPRKKSSGEPYRRGGRDRRWPSAKSSCPCANTAAPGMLPALGVPRHQHAGGLCLPGRNAAERGGQPITKPACGSRPAALPGPNP